jgi:hypothetical protein
MAATNWATPDDLAKLKGTAQPRRRRQQPERHLTDRIKRYARRGGWLPFHPYRSEKSDPGFLDLTLIRVPRLVVAELKVGDNTLTDWQNVWRVNWEILSMLAGPHLSIEVYEWRPEDWPEIERILK